MLSKRRNDHDRCFSQNSEYEHYRKLADPGGHPVKVVPEKSAEVDPVPSLGVCRHTAYMSLFI